MISTKLAAKPATQKQFDYIKALLAKHDATAHDYLIGLNRTRAMAGLMTAQEASALIDLIKECPLRPVADEVKAQDEAEAGVYRDGTEANRMFRVYRGQQSGRMLVKEILFDTDPESQGITYQYLGSAARCLPAGAIRLSVEEVGSLGKAWDHCMMCGRRLDDPESVDRGIGPVCAANY